MSNKVVVNLATGMEDPERVLIAFLNGHAAMAKGRRVAMFLTKDAVHLAIPGTATGVACDGCPPLERVYQQFADGGGDILACPFCVSSRGIGRGELRRARARGGRHTALGVDRRRGRDGVQLLKFLPRRPPRAV